jgi:hypothetical protein
MANVLSHDTFDFLNLKMLLKSNFGSTWIFRLVPVVIQSLLSIKFSRLGELLDLCYMF